MLLLCHIGSFTFAYTQVADFSVSSGPGENHEDFERSAETCNIDERLWFGSDFPDYPATPPATAAFDTNPDIVTDIIADINAEISKRANFEHSSLADHDLLLRPRRPRTAEANLTSKVMLGTIQSYPEMLIDGLRLPPFISPPCCGDEVQCQQSGHHQCLLPPFAACASIIRISQTRLPENRDFIWRTIYIEQQKLFHEYESYNKEMLLAAVQVVVLYTVLHISEAALVPKHYLKSIVQTLGTMMNSMLSLVDVGRFGQPDIIPGRHEWIYNESVRR
ncbi:hypothetical protein CEP51_004876 [Fusarium floridanum]|uniref:Amidohydrolase-related domain-containing protein n=1 Tax=Fusarium floridanum TaxID=1325733 RepID=A0A428RZA0_9HYPO|nr:hypothetical protein CEP51_004876 [Fusarium floridanum]